MDAEELTGSLKKLVMWYKVVSGWANTSCRFDFSQERSLCLSYVYVQW